jgi:LCP family protein required for cell wall assembly
MEFNAILILLCIAILGMGFLGYRFRRNQSRMHIESGNSYDMGAGYRNVVYKGKKYEYNQLITTVLYAGLDFVGEMQTYPRRGMAPRCDSISLVVLDKKHKKISVISINRDTICRIRRYGYLGDYYDYYDSNLGYSYAFGEGGEDSITNLTEAVTNLLGVPIDDYVITNRDSVATLNSIVGGVPVTVPNDDLILLHPELKAGAQVEITDDLVMDFVRYRDISIDFSNLGRQERQKAYISSYIEKFQSMMPGKANEVWKNLESIENYMQTSITKNKYISYTNLIGGMDFDETAFHQLEGEYIRATYHEEFYVDVPAMQDLIFSLFYEEA